MPLINEWIFKVLLHAVIYLLSLFRKKRYYTRVKNSVNCFGFMKKKLFVKSISSEYFFSIQTLSMHFYKNHSMVNLFSIINEKEHTLCILYSRRLIANYSGKLPIYNMDQFVKIYVFIFFKFFFWTINCEINLKNLIV